MTLRLRITLAAIGSLLAVTLILVVTSTYTQNQIEQRLAEANIRGKDVLWKKIITHDQSLMETEIQGLVRERNTRKALQKKDLVTLTENARTTYNALSTQKLLTQMQITDPEGRVLFSAPDDMTGRVRQGLVMQALDDGKIKWGIELHKGEPVAVVAFPFFMRGKTIGAGVFIKHLGDALADFKTNDESDVFILDASGQMKRGTDDVLYAQLSLNLPDIGTRHFASSKVNDTVYYSTILPILSKDGEALGHLVSVKDFTEEFEQVQHFKRIAYSIVILVLISVLSGISWYMNRSLKPLQHLAAFMRDISEGDLSAQLEVKGNDEIGQLQGAAKRMVDQLRDVLGRISGISQELASSAHQMTDIAEKTNQGIVQQQTEIDQVASAMTEMAQTSQGVAQYATEAASAASNADRETNQGRAVVHETIDSIKNLATEFESAAAVISELEKDTDNIGSVLDVIKGIAEQTNLLALNAAIEAARAGEQGRGFAVVADEVRTLASRTQQSTQQIQGMIERLQVGATDAVKVMMQSQQGVLASAEKAALTGDSLDSITHSISSINEMNIHMATTAEQQLAVAEEISRNIENISQVARKSAEGGVRTTTTSEQLGEMAEKLQSFLGRFKL